MLCCNFGCVVCRKTTLYLFPMMMVIALLFSNAAVQEGNNIITDTLFPSPKITFGHWSEYGSLHKHVWTYVLRLCFHTFLTFLEGWLLVIIARRFCGPKKTSLAIVGVFMYRVYGIYSHFIPDNLVKK